VAQHAGVETGTAAEAAGAALDLVPADPARAAAQAARAVELARRQGDRGAQSTAHRALGLAAHELGDLSGALTALHAAVRVATAAGLPQVAARARMSRAFVLLSQGRIGAALRDAEAAVASMRGLDRARALAQQGLVLQRSGHLDDALAVYATALPALRRHHDRLWEARLRNNRSLLHAYRGDPRRAKADNARADELFAVLDLPWSRASARWNLGIIEGKRGDIPASLAAFDSAIDAFRKADRPMAGLLTEKGTVLLSAGLADEALQTIAPAVAELSQGGQAADLAEVQLLLARAQLSAGEPGPAGESAAAARRGFTRQHRPSWAAAALYVEVHAAWAGGERSPRLLRLAREAARRLEATGWGTEALDIRLLIARIATDLGRLDLATAELRAAARARRAAQLERRARAWHALALLRVQSGDRRGAYAAVSAGLAAADRHRAMLGATELRVLVAAQVAELAALGKALAVEDGDAERVLGSAERYRAAALRIRPVLPPADERLAELRTALRLAADEAENARLSGAPVQVLSRRQHALEEQLRQRLRHAPGEQAPGEQAEAGGHPGRDPDAATVARLTTALAGRVLVEYVESGDDLYAVIIGAGRPALRALGPAHPVAAELDSLRFAWRRLLTGHGSAASLRAAADLTAHAAGRLDDALLAPLAPLLGGWPLVLVPPGSLRSLPWPMLPGCVGRPVTVAPSAASWLAARTRAVPGQPAALRPESASRAGRRVVLVAGPGLEGAADEIEALSAVYPGAQVLTGREATVSAALRALDGADVAHVAAHGSFRADNPLFSSLLLADGPLTVYDLERLGSAPRTIMLAACDSALSTAGPGDEMTGLAAALLAVGASAVIAPLLPLPDEVSARLAYGWHRRVSEGATPAAALAEVTAPAAANGPLAGLSAATLVCLGYGG
jgi:tetratricopeptide (TPR) repeat protein